MPVVRSGLSAILLASSLGPALSTPAWLGSVTALSPVVYASGGDQTVCRVSSAAAHDAGFDFAVPGFALGGRPNPMTGAGCSVTDNGFASGSDAMSLLEPSETLQASPFFVWYKLSTAGAIPVLATAYSATPVSSAPGDRAVCRAEHPTAGGVYAGSILTTGLSGWTTCDFGFGVDFVASSVSVEVLFELPLNAPPSAWTDAGAVPVLPTPSGTPSNTPSHSPTPSVTPSSSPSSTPPPPGAVTFVRVNASLGLSFQGAQSQIFLGLEAGWDTDGVSQIFTCVGRTNASDRSQVIAGKISARQDAGNPVPYVWNYCSVPLGKVETNAPTFDVIRDSDSLIWCNASSMDNAFFQQKNIRPAQLGLAPPGAVVGLAAGEPVTPCRASDITTGRGVHAGTIVKNNSVLVCAFGYGGGVQLNPDYDMLFLLPPLSPADMATAKSPSNCDLVPDASATPTPSITPSRSVTPTTSVTPSVSPSPMVRGPPMWVSLQAAIGLGVVTPPPVAGGLYVVNGRGFLAAGKEDDGKIIYPCRARAPSISRPGTNDTLIGKWIVSWSFCDVPYNGTLALNDADFELILFSPFISWSAPGSAPTGPGSLFFTPADVGGAQSAVCRAYFVPPSSTPKGPHSGYVSPAGCVFSYGGGTKVINPYEIAFTLPDPLSVDSWNASALPVPSLTPSRTPGLPSSTATAIGPSIKAAKWVLPNLHYPDNSVDAVQAGVDSDTGLPVSVCRGSLSGNPAGTPTGEVVSGAWIRGHADWGCELAIGGTGEWTLYYELLRPSTYLRWVDSAVPLGTLERPAGSFAVTAGVYDGRANYVCRAKHPVVKDGPFVGFTEGPVCHFMYGPEDRVIVDATVFEVLYLTVDPSATPSATASRSIGSTVSPTPSRSVGSSFSASPSAGLGIGGGPAAAAAAPNSGAATGAVVGGIVGGVLAGVAIAIVSVRRFGWRGGRGGAGMAKAPLSTTAGVYADPEAFRPGGFGPGGASGGLRTPQRLR